MAWKVVAGVGWATFTVAVAAASALQVEDRPTDAWAAFDVTAPSPVMVSWEDLPADVPADVPALPLVEQPVEVATAPAPPPTAPPARFADPATLVVAPVPEPAPVPATLAAPPPPPPAVVPVATVAALVDEVLPGTDIGSECLSLVASALPLLQPEALVSGLPVVDDLRVLLDRLLLSGMTSTESVVAGAADCLDAALSLVPPIDVGVVEVDLSLLPGLLEAVAPVIDLEVVSNLLGVLGL